MNVAQLPSFSEILRLMSPTEAQLLDVLYSSLRPHGSDTSMIDVTNGFGFNNTNDLCVVVDNLMRQRLLARADTQYFQGIEPHGTDVQRITCAGCNAYD